MDIIKINIDVLSLFQITEKYFFTLNFIKNKLSIHFSLVKFSKLFQLFFSRVNPYKLRLISFFIEANYKKNALFLLILKKEGVWVN